jgi:lipid II:glycine glycyltransferase (peptidoglycan interpeptide bridge formation enzyme)
MTSVSFFLTPAWFDVLNLGFGTSSHRINGTLAVTIFRIGPLGFAYANFPVGIRTREALDTVMQPEINRAIKAEGGDLLRFSVPESLAQQGASGALRLPETCIHNLADWTEQGLAGDVRYEVRRSRREGIEIRPARLSDARFLYESYQATVKRHAGQLRYTQRYFEALCRLAETSQEVTVLIAVTPHELPCGFIVTARSGEDVFYLHAGFDHEHASGRPSYALLCAAITEAREKGCNRFNMMASPVHQPMLVRFKEKWGGQTQDLLNFDIPISMVGRIARVGQQLRQALFLRRLR